MRSKKGALFHWIGIVVIFALAFVVLSPAEFGVTPKGTWQLDFLHTHFVEAEKQLVDSDQVALEMGRKTVLSLASTGGFADTPSCGAVEGITYWNKGTDFCFLNVDQEVNEQFNTWYKKHDKGASFTLSRQGKELIGKADREILLGQKGTQYYALNSGFRVNVDYDFDEYFKLQDEAKKLVNECKSASQLQDCLEKVKPSYWKFSSCEQEKFAAQGRKVAFCIESPQKYAVFEKGKFVPVQYKAGLDFEMS
jgi:hypothetical protein